MYFQVGDDVAAPGVGTYNHKTGDVTYKAYYQWVPFVLFLQAGMFYAPHLLNKNWEGGKVRNTNTKTPKIAVSISGKNILSP